MTITHKIPWIGLIICLAELLFSVSAIASDPIFAKGLLWKIETPGAKPSYIFGTMHSEDERITRLPGKVDQAFQQVSSFTMEVKLDEMLALDTAAMMTFTDGKNLKSVAGPKLYSRVASLMTKYGIPEVILNSLKPWAVFVTLSMPQAKTGMFLDRVLYSEAKHRGIALYGLETAQEQLTVFDHFSMRDQVRMLQETVDNYDKFSHLLEQLTQAYLARDLAQMVALNQKYMQIGDRKLADKLMDSLIYERNLRMVQRMRPRLKDGNAFVAIGALHLPGEKGVLRLLQNRGYTVSVVY